MKEQILDHISKSQALTAEEGMWLYQTAPLAWLQETADLIRKNIHANKVFFNRNIHFEPTNKCIYSCKFCSFYRQPFQTEEDGMWDYSLEDLKKLLEKHPKGTLTEIHITGGVHPDRGIDWGEELLQYIRTNRPELHIKAFTAVEITWMAKVSKLELNEALKRLKSAGLDSLPGGGAEIFDKDIRKKIAGGKAPADRWLEVHKCAHKNGIQSNATMLYGHIETYEHRIDHMLKLRQLQEESNGFNAFIPLRYRNENNTLSNLPEVSEDEDLRNFAVSRIFLHNFKHLKAYWVMLGVENALKSLEYGVDDIDGTVNDTTKIYSMAGSMETPVLTSDYLKDEVSKRGRIPIERDSLYQEIS